MAWFYATIGIIAFLFLIFLFIVSMVADFSEESLNLPSKREVQKEILKEKRK